jgi:hypothetical protein
MKTTALAFVLIAALSAGSFAAETNLRGVHVNDATPPRITDQRNLKKEKAAKDDGGAKTPKPPKNSGAGGGATDDANRAGVDDGTCCNGPAGPQPATGPGNRAPSNCPDLGRQLPVYRIEKGSQEYIDGIPKENACSCNDQCAFQDGTSMVCCLQSHYFVDVNRHPINVCVDTTGLNESVMNGCLVGGAGGDGGEVPVLRSSVAGGSEYADPLDYDLMGVRR